MKHIIYCFSGTGNSLYAAQQIAAALENCEILPLITERLTPEECGSIGFVYPVYFQGIPLLLREFIRKLDLSHNPNTYLYAVATYGAVHGNGLPQLARLLREKQAVLSYGAYLNMFSNYVVMYDMKKDVAKYTAKSDRELARILPQIIGRQTSGISRPNRLLERYYAWRATAIAAMDRGYQVSDACISCGLCEKLCPVNNIRMTDGRPRFSHHCEQCVACIQYCPNKAINFKKKTIRRGRYTNPEVNAGQLIAFKNKESGLSSNP